MIYIKNKECDFIYQALYRKWRPLTFDDVVSQPHIKSTLQNQIKGEKTAHSYLFTGSRGTGKTTCARIFAKAINCLNPIDGQPCLECEVCKNADLSALSDIIEIDAASNNGVDDIRDLREGANYTPEFCKYKVYIIDEVHMLSVNAFNALLKIMEEPPSYVKFILATTEVHKVPATIISRCQRFDFRRITPPDIADRLNFIAQEEKINLEQNAAELIAKIADGGMRDALSLLDQAISFSNDISVETVSFAAGIAGRDHLFDIIQSIIENDCTKAISIVDNLYAMSKDISRLCEELLSQMRNLMLVKTVPSKTDLLACLPDEIERLNGFANSLTLEKILEKITLLQECNERLVRSVSKRTEFEMCLVKLCSSTENSSQSADINLLLSKIARLESTINTLETEGVQTKKVVQKRTENKVLTPPQQAENSVDMSKITPDMFKPLDSWAEILESFDKINPAVSGSLRESVAYCYNNILLILVKNEFFINLFRIKENATSLRDVVKAHTGINYDIKAKYSGENKVEKTQSPVDRLLSKAENSDIQVEYK